ncbi:DUF2599 domain-containing protein [Pseudomonas sp. UMAB-40]|uniref:DUF2599 domain-containing protein n=1 Tax=Pseudomonas sp. UMAB-40 TaxID=1365407 RepID=UPI001C5A1901|nr:DUF2599 domain-containing protein [Pseudomonas sp. UMAB-40]
MNRHPWSLLCAGLLMSHYSLSYADPLTAKAADDRKTISIQRCAKYIEKAEWFLREYKWSIAITPTPCARETQVEQTPYLWDELTRDYSNSRYWKNTHGLRHQLICHLEIARDKPQWILEPWRPDVGYQLTLAAGCNHVTPLPEKAP